jgi:hypothetical protein
MMQQAMVANTKMWWKRRKMLEEGKGKCKKNKMMKKGKLLQQ